MENSRDKEFFHLIMSHEKRLYAYILMFVPHGADADDIMQETLVVMWRRFHVFELGTDFSSWAKKIAYHKILDFRKKQKSNRLFFSEKMMEFIAAHEEEKPDLIDIRLKALESCIQKLRREDRELIDMHYHQVTTIKSIAERTKRSVEVLYKVMARIHLRLLRCINNTLAGSDVI